MILLIRVILRTLILQPAFIEEGNREKMIINIDKYKGSYIFVKLYLSLLSFSFFIS